MAAPAVCPAEADASDEAGMLPASRARRRLRQLLPGRGGARVQAGRAAPAPFLPVSPEVMKRRRRGIIESRGTSSRPTRRTRCRVPAQARRKEWSEYRGWLGGSGLGPGRSRGRVGSRGERWPSEADGAISAAAKREA